MDPFVGEIRIMSFGFAPQGWALCNGQLLSIVQNQALFALIGTTYGGDGKTTFALPNLQGAGVVGVAQGGKPALGEMVGERQRHLAVQAVAAAPMASAGAFNVTAAPTFAAGHEAGQPSENAVPFLALNYFIALQGIFPTRM